MCHCSLALALMVDGRDDEAGTIFAELVRRFPEDPYVRLWRMVWLGRRGEVAAVRAGFTAAVTALARVDEGCTCMAAAARALIGDRDEALGWIAHMIRDRGFVAWPYFAERDPFLASLGTDTRFQTLLTEMHSRFLATRDS